MISDPSWCVCGEVFLCGASRQDGPARGEFHSSNACNRPAREVVRKGGVLCVAIGSAVVSREERLFVAQCLDVDLASQGATEEEAIANLREALELAQEESSTQVAWLDEEIRKA
jgi:hypothetical protein